MFSLSSLTPSWKIRRELPLQDVIMSKPLHNGPETKSCDWQVCLVVFAAAVVVSGAWEEALKLHIQHHFCVNDGYPYLATSLMQQHDNDINIAVNYENGRREKHVKPSVSCKSSNPSENLVSHGGQWQLWLLMPSVTASSPGSAVRNIFMSLIVWQSMRFSFHGLERPVKTLKLESCGTRKCEPTWDLTGMQL